MLLGVMSRSVQRQRHLYLFMDVGFVCLWDVSSHNQDLASQYCLRASFLLAGWFHVHPFLLPLRPPKDGGPVLGRCSCLCTGFTFLWFGALRVLVRVLRVLVLIEIHRGPWPPSGSRGDGHGTRLLFGFALAWLHVVCRVPQCTNCFTLNEHCCRISGPLQSPAAMLDTSASGRRASFLTLRRSGSREDNPSEGRSDFKRKSCAGTHWLNVGA